MRYGATHFDELHAYWDDTLVGKIGHTADYRKLALYLKPRIDLEGWKTPGDYHQWAETWASVSVKESHHAYQGIVFKSAEKARNGKLKLIHIELPASYDQDQLPRAASQLVKAGVHLAYLLDSLKWE